MKILDEAAWITRVLAPEPYIDGRGFGRLTASAGFHLLIVGSSWRRERQAGSYTCIDSYHSLLAAHHSDRERVAFALAVNAG